MICVDKSLLASQARISAGHGVGRARERGEAEGFMKIVVDADSEHILGAALLGIVGDEVVHSLLTAMAAGVPYKLMQQTVPIRPTVSELIPTLLGQLALSVERV
jgi:pyruvate/2-oxoglutarate dehydrogenase complex dihydrolipoamide dehydrogenase (E3) component